MSSEVFLGVTCPFCLGRNFLKVKEADLEMFKEGNPVQICFPYLKSEHREMIVSGICNFCWERHRFEHLEKGVELLPLQKTKRILSFSYLTPQEMKSYGSF